ncbi:hypothetical protein [Hydrocarboniphaga sp.]|uniref:hypothetical protein n=1 Tax=Hydrocarboniphaga sp. TaxID=2033016 RepID=UPI003D0DEE77
MNEAQKMAENEILDLSSRRWQRTRAALVTPSFTLTAIAECAADDLNRGLRLQLSKALQSGQTLLTVLQATEQHPAAMRAVVESFQDQQLVRVARNAIAATPSKEPAAIARCMTAMLIDSVMGKVPVLAERSGCFEDSARREALMQAVRQEFESRRSGLTATIEASLRGQPVRRLRQTGAGRTQPPVEASALVHSPLAIRVGGGNHVPGQR